MKKLSILVSIIVSAALNLSAANLSATFADDIWKGSMVPKTEVCSNFNTKVGSTPSIILENIPSDATKIVLKFSDETFKGMSDGGHGIIAYKIAKNSSKVTIPSIKGETFDLPKEFSIVVEHRGKKFGKTPGAYLAPCSGGKGNTYSVLIKAMNGEEVLDTTSLTLGTF
ncbi:MAG: hypothetical protein ACJAWW_002004 [Sulfurimonas sp.]|jgi:hypothetical protein